MFGLGFALGSLIHSNNYNSDYCIASDIHEQNEIKKKELKQQHKQKERDEWLDRIKRMTDDSLIKLFNNTKEYNYTQMFLTSGVGDKQLCDLGVQKTINKEYIDIKNECEVRGLL